MEKKYIDMTPEERVEYRIRTNREIEERSASALAAQAVNKTKKLNRKFGKAVKDLHDALPPEHRAGFRMIVNECSDNGPFIFRTVGR